MYLNDFDKCPAAAATPLVTRRSLSGDFVFLTQDASVAYMAEACIDVLRSANRLIGYDAYSWEHPRTALDLSKSEGAVCSQDQTLVLIGGTERAWQPDEETLSILRSTIRSAARVCVVGGAVFVPLAAGVLGAKRLAVHPNFRPGMEEVSHGLDFFDGVTCHHKALSSATGPISAVRMMTELVGARDGEFTRAALSRYLGLSEPDKDCSSGEPWRYSRMAQGDGVISEALKIMVEHLEDTLSVGQIADILDVSSRKLERGFRERLLQTPLKVYRDLRLDRAHSLLSQTNMPINEVSVACGFSNVTLMKKWFVEKYNVLPDDVRRHAFAGPQAA